MSCPTGNSTSACTRAGSSGVLSPARPQIPSAEQFAVDRLRTSYGITETDPGEIRRWVECSEYDYVRQFLIPEVVAGRMSIDDLKARLDRPYYAQDGVFQYINAQVHRMTLEEYSQAIQPYISGDPRTRYRYHLVQAMREGHLDYDTALQRAGEEIARQGLYAFCCYQAGTLEEEKLARLWQASRSPNDTETYGQFRERVLSLAAKANRVPFERQVEILGEAGAKAARRNWALEQAHTLTYEQFRDTIQPYLDANFNEAGLRRAYRKALEDSRDPVPLAILAQFPPLALEILDAYPAYEILATDAHAWAQMEMNRRNAILTRSGFIEQEFHINIKTPSTTSLNTAKAALKRAVAADPETTWELEEELWCGERRYWVVGRRPVTAADLFYSDQFLDQHKATVRLTLERGKPVSMKALMSHPELLLEFPDAIGSEPEDWKGA